MNNTVETKPLSSEQIREKQNANLKPFKAGESGNPDGRPIGQKNYATLYKEALIKLAKLNDKEPEEIEAEIISKGILSARGGDYRFYKDVLDRLLGSAQSNVNLNANVTMADLIKQAENAKRLKPVSGQRLETPNPLPDKGQGEQPDNIPTQQSPATLQPA